MKKNISATVGGILVGAGLTAAVVKLSKSDKAAKMVKKTKKKVTNQFDKLKNKAEAIEKEIKK